MTFDESKIIEDVDEKLALAFLLVNEELHLFNVRTDWNKEYTTAIAVNCSDVFEWGCADSENLNNNDGSNPSEIIELYKSVKENIKWGSTKWVCIKRNTQPQLAIINKMKEDNYWDDIMENLPLNTFNKIYETI